MVINIIRTVQAWALDFIRNWWRPVGLINLVGAIFVNTIYLPLHKGEGVDLPGLALVVTSFAPVVAIRAWENSKNPPTT